VPKSSAVFSVLFTSEKHLIFFFNKWKNGIVFGKWCFFYLTKICKYFGINYQFFYNRQIERINHGLCHERITRIVLMICSCFCQSWLSNWSNILKLEFLWKIQKKKKKDLINVRPIGTCKGLEPLSQHVASDISLVWVMETFFHCHLEKRKIMIVTNPLKVIVQLNLHVSTMASNPTKKKNQLWHYVNISKFMGMWLSCTTFHCLNIFLIISRWMHEWVAQYWCYNAIFYKLILF